MTIYYPDKEIANKKVKIRLTFHYNLKLIIAYNNYTGKNNEKIHNTYTTLHAHTLKSFRGICR
jgi:hypothetical protein